MKNKARTKKGQMGIGTLIIFIAIILVAAIAAAVLLGTGGSLQQRALTTGKQTEREVSGGITVVTVTGTDGSSGNSINTFEVLVKLAAGSDPIALNDTIITVDTKTTTQSLQYHSNASQGGTTYYNVTYVKEGSEHANGYLSTGDIAKIMYQTTSAIEESQTIRTRIIPKHGIIVPVDYITPDVIIQRRILLYP